MNRYQKLCLSIAKKRAFDESDNDYYQYALDYFYKSEKVSNKNISIDELLKLSKLY